VNTEIKNNVLVVGFGSFGRESLISLKKSGMKFTSILVVDDDAHQPVNPGIDIILQQPPIPALDNNTQSVDLDAPYWLKIFSKINISTVTHAFLIGDIIKFDSARSMEIFSQAMMLSSVLTFPFYITSYENLDQNTSVDYLTAIEMIQEVSHLSAKIILDADDLKDENISAVVEEARTYIENFTRTLLFNLEYGFRKITDNGNEEISIDFSDVFDGKERMQAVFASYTNKSVAVATDKVLSSVTEKNPISVIVNIFDDLSNDDVANEVLTKVQKDLSPGEIWFGAHRTEPNDNETEVSLLLYY
jgi:hypothetical protein